jgi:hypothetical protein
MTFIERERCVTLTQAHSQRVKRSIGWVVFAKRRHELW